LILKLFNPPGLATGVSFFFDPAFGAAFGLEGRAASSAARSASFSAFFFAGALAPFRQE
jgi:hypothetical protein